MKTFSDIIVSEGTATTILNGETVLVNIESPKGKNELSFEFSVDELPLENIITKFQLNSLEDVYDKNITDLTKFSLRTLTFINASIIGYSAPSQAFEFQVTGDVVGSEIFSSASNVYFIIQKYNSELTNVKCLLFAVLKDQSPSTLNKLTFTEDIIPDIPLFTPVEKKVALTISSGDFLTLNIDGVREAANVFVGDVVAGKVIHKGTRIIYKLKRFISENVDVAITVRKNESAADTNAQGMQILSFIYYLQICSLAIQMLYFCVMVTCEHNIIV